MKNYDKIYINGQWVASEAKATISVFDSITEEVMATPGAHTAISGPKQLKRAE